MAGSDVDATVIGCARLHGRAFSDSFLTALGTDFLEAFYAEAFDQEGVHCLLTHDPAGAGDDRFITGVLVYYEPGHKLKLWPVLRRLGPFGGARSALAAMRSRQGRYGLLENLRARPDARHAHALDSMYLATIAVDPESRGNGSGSRLVDELMRRARDVAAPVHLETRQDPESRSWDLYASRGFVTATTHRRLGGEVRVVLCWNGASGT